MSDSLFATVSGCQSLMTNLEIISNNLANASTVGFKRDSLAFESLIPKDEDRNQGSFEKLFSLDPPLADTVYSSIVNKYTDYSPGPIKHTSLKTDLAINGDGFFKIKVGEEIHLTRNGQFTLNKEGILTTQEGYPLIGNTGSIKVSDPDFNIDVNGKLQQFGKTSDIIEVVHFEGKYPLYKVGGNRYKQDDPQRELKINENAEVLQGRLENSNINMAKSLTELIAVSRLYEVYNRNLQNYRKLDSKAAVEIAKV